MRNPGPHWSDRYFVPGDMHRIGHDDWGADEIGPGWARLCNACGFGAFAAAIIVVLLVVLT